MSSNFWQKLNYIIGIIAISILFGVMAFAANIEIKDLDLWLHLGMGKFILENGYVPDKDMLSCTIQGRPWINHEWLFQVTIYTIYKIWGALGLNYMQVSIAVITMCILLFLGYNKDRQLGTLLMLLITFVVYQSRFTHRPDLFSLLFFAIYIYILALHIDKRWSVYVLFIIQVLWSNFHGFFFFGPIFVAIGLVSE